MANRSDINSALPRRLKRMLTLTSTGDKHQDAVVRKLFIEAHRTSLSVRAKRMSAKTNIDSSTEE